MPSSSWTDNTTMSAKGLQPEIKFSDFMRICFPHLSKDVEVSTKKGTNFVPNRFYYTDTTDKCSDKQSDFPRTLCNDTQVYGQQKSSSRMEVEVFSRNREFHSARY